MKIQDKIDFPMAEFANCNLRKERPLHYLRKNIMTVALKQDIETITL